MDNLTPGYVYHIYNRGINSCRLFDDDADFSRFMELYRKFIVPVADTFAYALMSNHFHIAVRIRENIVYRYTREEWKRRAQPSVVGRHGSVESSHRTNDAMSADDIVLLHGSVDKIWDNVKWLTRPSAADDEGRKIPSASYHLAHMFSAYAKYYNIRHGRHSSLFEHPFKRKMVGDEDYLRNLIAYINQNPVRHGVVSHPSQYLWSSFNGIVTSNGSITLNDEVTQLFGSMGNFIARHDAYENFDWEDGYWE